MCKTTNNYHHTVLFWRCTKNERLVKKKKRRKLGFIVCGLQRRAVQRTTDKVKLESQPHALPHYGPHHSLSPPLFLLSHFLTLKP